MYKELFIARKERGETQKDIADLLNIARATYTNKEQGRKAFTIPEAVTLSKHFNLSLDYLFNEKEDKQQC